jgi:hypothetical protein
MGDHPEHLAALVGGDVRNVVVIANALDDAPADVRRSGLERELAALADLGFDGVELDLRDYLPRSCSPAVSQGQVVKEPDGPVRAGLDTKARITHSEGGVITPPAQFWRPDYLNLIPGRSHAIFVLRDPHSGSSPARSPAGL